MERCDIDIAHDAICFLFLFFLQTKEFIDGCLAAEGKNAQNPFFVTFTVLTI